MRYKVSIKNMTREQVMVYVDFILDGHNIQEAITHFNSSRKYINDVLNKVRLPDGAYYNELLATKIELTLERLLLETRAKAGSKSRRGLSISDEQAVDIVCAVIDKSETLRSLAKQYNCSTTTIANAIKRVATSKKLAEIVKVRREKPKTISEQEHLNMQRKLLENPDVIDDTDALSLEEIKKMYSSWGRK